MPTLLAKSAEVLVTMDGKRRELRNAGVYAEDGIIKQVGRNAELPATADMAAPSLQACDTIETMRWL